jgi:hypothetical protein
LGTGVEAGVRPGVRDVEERQPSVSQALHPLPGQSCSLAAAPKRHEPVPYGLGAVTDKDAIMSGPLKGALKIVILELRLCVALSGGANR